MKTSISAAQDNCCRRRREQNPRKCSETVADLVLAEGITSALEMKRKLTLPGSSLGTEKERPGYYESCHKQGSAYVVVRGLQVFFFSAQRFPLGGAALAFADSFLPHLEKKKLLFLR